VKDLALLDRDLSQSIIVDNSPMSYIFQPENSIDVTSFIDDMHDNELDVMGAFLTKIAGAGDVRAHLAHWREGESYDLGNGYGPKE